MKIALIGCGTWGKNHARDLHELGVLSAIADPHATDIAKQYDVPLYCDIDELLRKEQPQALVIASPDVTHAKMAEKALHAGLDIFVEKPLTLEFEQAKKICDLAKQKEAILMVGHLLRYHPAFQCLLQAAQEGKIGEIQHILSIRHDIFRSPRDRDVIWGYGPHDASMVMALADHQDFAAGYCYGDVEKECLLQGHFENGLHATISLSWQSPKKRLLVATGTKGQLVFDDARPYGKKILLQPRYHEWQELPYQDYAPLKYELQHFIESVENRTEPLTGTYEALHCTAFLHACYASYQAIGST